MTIQPIWKTLEADLTDGLTDGRVDFTVSAGGSSIYTGRAYADTQGACVVALNDILRPHLGMQGITLTGQTFLDTKAVEAFTVTYGSPARTKTVKVLNDWSYEERGWADDAPVILSEAVTERWDCWTIRPFTMTGATSYGWEFRDTAGTVKASGTRTIAGHSETFFARPSVPGTLTLTLHNGTAAVERTYPIGNRCDRGALIYRNRIGGFDVLPIASVTENEAYKRETYDVSGRNWSRETHLTRSNGESVTRTVKLRTPVLTDTEAARMFDAAGTVQAWIHTPERGYEAVTVKTGSCKRKTFRNEGRKRVVYDIEVTFAQPVERR